MGHRGGFGAGGLRIWLDENRSGASPTTLMTSTIRITSLEIYQADATLSDEKRVSYQVRFTLEADDFIRPGMSVTLTRNTAF